MVAIGNMEAIVRRFFLLTTLATASLLACGSDLNDNSSSSGSGANSAAGGSSANSSGSGGQPVGQLGDPMTVHSEYSQGGPHYLNSRVHGDTLVVCTGRFGFKTFDISDPTSLTELASIQFSLGKRCEYLTIDTANSIAFVTHQQEQANPQSYIAAVDISNPQNPQEIAIVARDDNPAGLDVAGSLVAVAAKADGLLLYNFENNSFQPLGTVPMTAAYNLRIVDGLAYVANGADGLTVVDLSDPNNPQKRGSVDLGGIAKDLVIDNNRAYVATAGEGVATVDISDPDAPKLLDSDSTPGSATAIAISPELNGLFIADWNDIRLFDISDRDNPAPLGREPLELGMNKESRTMGIASDGANVYGSNWDMLGAYEFHPGLSAPDLVISPADLLLADAATGETSAGTIILSNDGPHALTDIAISADGGLSVQFVPETIAPFSTEIIEVQYTAPNPQPLNEIITISSNDIDQASQNINVFANQQGLGIGDAVSGWTYFDLDNNAVALADYPGHAILLAYFSTF